MSPFKKAYASTEEPGINFATKGKARENKRLAEKEFCERRLRLKSFPQMIAIHTTDVCNLRCVACDYGQRKATPIEISEKGYEHAFEVFPCLDTVGIAGAEMFFDRGNPKGYMQRVFEAGKKYPDIRFVGFTNGTLLDPGKTELIVEKFKWIGISIDSPEPEVYKTIHVGGDLNHVIENMKKISERKRQAGRRRSDNPEIVISSVINERTYKSLIEMINLARDVGAAAIHYQDPWEGTYVNENIFSNRYKTLEYLYLRKEASTKAKAFGITILDRTRNSIIKNMPDLLNLLEIPTDVVVDEWPKCCDAPWRELYISGNGDVQVCCASNTILGNINEQSISQIWNSSEAIALRWRILKGDYLRDCKPRCNRGYFLPLHKRRKLSHRLINLMLDRKRLAGLLGNKQWIMGLLRDRKRLADVILDRRV